MNKYFQFQGIKSRILKGASELKLILFVLLSCTQLLNAAIDPVTVIVSMSPPYTPFISEYASTGVNKLQVTLIVNDSRLLNYPAQLHMFIERVDGGGVIMRTNEYAAIAPIMLTGLTTEIFTGADLTNHFMAQNNIFTGFDQSQYITTGRIPDGQYRIGFQVVDAQRSDVVLSNVAYSQAGWFLLNDPPYLNLPINGEEQRINDPQSIKLEWFPRHLGSMNSAFLANYQVELFAIRIPGMDPNQLVLSMQPDYTEITNQTSLYLSSMNYMLEPGVEYAWRVKAFTDNGFTLFQNGGYSEVYSFVYGSLCPVPENVQAEVMGPERAVILWDTDPIHTSYETRFRVKDQEDAIWHTKESYIGSVELNTLLSANTSYEYQVKAKTPTVESDYSELAEFTTTSPANQDFECGLQDSTRITNYNPKNTLSIGDYIYNGDFPIKLSEVSGGDGVFTGKGRMRIPFLGNIQVNMEFSNIKINELNQVYEGKLVSIYNPNSKFYIDDITDYWSVGDQVGNIITGQEVAQIEVDYTISDAGDIQVVIIDNKAIVTNSDGGTTTETISTSTGGTTISDASGNLYAVDEDGNVTKVGESGDTDGSTNYGSTLSNYNKLAADSSIEFTNSSNNLWAFDSWNEKYEDKAIISKEYESIEDYHVAWKLIPAGKSGKIFAKVTSGDIDLSKVQFKTPAGTEYFAESVDGGLELTVIGSEHGDGQEIFALYPQTDSTIISIGKVKVASYDMIIRKLFIVPIDELNVNVDEIEKGVNDIFLQYGVEWDVQQAQPFVDKTWDINEDDKLDAGETGMFTMYTDEMKALNKAYSDSNTIDEEAIYVFVVQNSTGSTGVLLGDMPISSQFGYIFSPEGADITAKTVAHELGHGMFQLKHTFDEDYAITKSTTDNLMDYTEGTHLFKQQWDAMYDQQALLFAFLQDEEEGELMANMPNFFGQKVIAPNRSNQGIHEDAIPIQDENDYTIAFITPDEKAFLWVDEGQWEGYFENGEKAIVSGYFFYVEDKYMRESDPLSWGIYLAANDLGGFAIDMIESPGETTKGLATGIWKIATFQFDLEKTWDRIISADRADGAYVVSTLALGYLAGPKCKKLIAAEEAPQFQEMLGQYTSKVRPTKLTWPELLALFKKAREFEKLVSKHLKTIFKAEDGFNVTSQVYLKVDGVMTIADDIIFNSKTGEFILNESKYGVSNLLSKNQQVIETAIKAGKEIEIRSLEGVRDVTNRIVAAQGDKIKITKILRSNSVDGTITSNTIKTTWP